MLALPQKSICCLTLPNYYRITKSKFNLKTFYSISGICSLHAKIKNMPSDKKDKTLEETVEYYNGSIKRGKWERFFGALADKNHTVQYIQDFLYFPDLLPNYCLYCEKLATNYNYSSLIEEFDLIQFNLIGLCQNHGPGNINDKIMEIIASSICKKISNTCYQYLMVDNSVMTNNMLFVVPRMCYICKLIKIQTLVAVTDTEFGFIRSLEKFNIHLCKLANYPNYILTETDFKDFKEFRLLAFCNLEHQKFYSISKQKFEVLNELEIFTKHPYLSYASISIIDETETRFVLFK